MHKGVCVNKVYNIVWCAAKCCFQVCSELGKNGSGASNTQVKKDQRSILGDSKISAVLGSALLGCTFSTISLHTNAASCPTTISSAMTASCSVSSGSSVTVTNAGSINITTGSPILVTGTSATSVTNDGTLVTNDGRGIRVENGGSVSDGIVNTGTINAAGHGIEVFNGSTVSAGTTVNGAAIYNSGSVVSTSDAWGDEAALRIQKASTINGDILNDTTGYMSGDIAGIYISDASTTVNGDIINNGEIYGGTTGVLVSASTVNGAILNNGIISGNSYGIYNTGSLVDGINNTGTISSSSTGVYNAGLLGSLINSGTITGSSYAIYNAGTVSSSIDNYGVLNGNVVLGAATLNLLSSTTAITTQPEVHGDISGDSSGNSVINVGSASDATIFTTDGNANVGTINIASGSTLALSDGNSWYASGDFTNNGTITLADTTTSNVTVGAGGTFTNAGTIDLTSNAVAGDTFTVNGNYVGNNGSLLLDSVLGDDASLTDKLVITGDASGTTYVTVTNLGGSGSQTVEGLEVIEVDGTSTANAFVQNGRIVAGAYEYSLVQGNTSGTDTESWYLSSKNTSATQTLRPEAGSYLANLAAANTLFEINLQDRFAASKTNSQTVWIKGTTDRTKFKDTTGQISTQTNQSTVQLGVDLVQLDNSQDQHFAAGLMTGYGKATSDSHSSISGYQSTGTVDGYNIGVYATLSGDQANQSNFYVDGWALWNSLNARVNGTSLVEEKYNLSGMSASLETGYAFKVASNLAYAYFIQPKAQLIWSGIDADEHTETNGTKVVGNANNLQSSIGLKAYMANSSTAQAATLQPFVEMNWLHNSHPYAISMDDGQVEQDGSKNIAEFKLGVNGQISPNAGVWLNATSQLGSNDYRNYGVKVGFKYSF
nr:autotransporter outer membrane beta-barrel domain-containing protein [Acinetobacter sp. ME22]